MPQHTDQETFEHMEKVTQKFFPKYKVVPKTSMWVHRFIGGLFKALRFNKVYMTNFWTYFNNRNAYPIEDKPGEHYRSWRVHMHEGTHASQEKTFTGFLWGSLYLLGTPVYAVAFFFLCLPFFITGALVSWLPWWSGFIVFGTGLLLSSPVPFGYWRSEWELQGYGASVATKYWTDGDVPDSYIEDKVGTFAGGEYFYMNVFSNKVRKRLKKARNLVENKKFIPEWLPRCSSFYSAYYRGLKEQGRTKV
jgi:hypothetical protein